MSVPASHVINGEGLCTDCFNGNSILDVEDFGEEEDLKEQENLEEESAPSRIVASAVASDVRTFSPEPLQYEKRGVYQVGSENVRMKAQRARRERERPRSSPSWFGTRDEIRTRLLKGIARIFEARAIDRIKPGDLVAALLLAETWPIRLKTSTLHRLLSPLGIRPRFGLGFGNLRCFGYWRESFCRQTADASDAVVVFWPPSRLRRITRTAENRRCIAECRGEVSHATVPGIGERRPRARRSRRRIYPAGFSRSRVSAKS
jgi:hypothetical protein